MCHPLLHGCSGVPLQALHPLQSHKSILEGYTSSLEPQPSHAGPGSVGSVSFGIKVSSSLSSLQCLTVVTFLVEGM